MSIGIDQDGNEYARLEMKDVAIGGTVKTDLLGGDWNVQLDCGGGRVMHARHEYRDAAVVMALAKALGFTIHGITPSFFG